MMLRNDERLSMRRVVVGRGGGFTLLELLIVTGLMASLAAFSWPSVRRSLARADRLRAVESVRSLLADARSRALTRGRPHVLRFDDRRGEMELLEVRFDEAGAELFESDPGQVRVRPQPSAGVHRGGIPPQTATGMAAQRNDLAGPELKLVESRDLPENFRCREMPHEDSPHRGSALMLSQDESSDSLSSSLPASRLDAAATSDTGAHVVQLVFDVAGRTADIRLEICGPDGFCTPLSVTGALGNVRAGAPHRRASTSSADGVPEATP
jgi:prepilin-type N-terminal cleavage/methylation domain-containing protein